ncbi:MAG: hypothetical protein HQ555_02770 [Candidatus Aminicenantes bacterium]|nr:hypothetical protein [Candidatus Aminicenantes bacterium]
MVHKIGDSPHFVRAKPETEQLLTRWGKSCVFSESTGLSFLRHTRRSTLSTSLDSQNPKAKSSMVAYAISQNFNLRYLDLEMFPNQADLRSDG